MIHFSYRIYTPALLKKIMTLARRNRVEFTGQVIGEILLALAIGAILITTAAGGIAFFLQENYKTRGAQVAGSLAKEYLDEIKSIGESSWTALYVPPGAKGPASQFYVSVNASGTGYAILAGTTTTVREGQTFTRSFSLENVNRDSCGVGNITSAAPSACAMQIGPSFVAQDPSTQKVTVTVSWGTAAIQITQYVGRSSSKTLDQTDWSGGTAATTTVFSAATNQFTSSTNVNYTTGTGSIVVQGF